MRFLFLLLLLVFVSPANADIVYNEDKVEKAKTSIEEYLTDTYESVKVYRWGNLVSLGSDVGGIAKNVNASYAMTLKFVWRSDSGNFYDESKIFLLDKQFKVVYIDNWPEE